MNQNANVIKRNDELTSKIVRARDPYCFYPYCNNPSVHNCHIFGRVNMSIRFDPECCTGGCEEHHHWVDTHPKLKKTMFRQHLGHEKYERLQLLSNQNCKLLPSDLKEINTNLKNELKAYDN